MTDINISKLSSLPLSERNNLPSCSAIYFAFLDSGELLYVGRAVNLNLRWKNHHRFKQLESMGNVLIAWLKVDTQADLDDLESSFIQGFEPRLNGTSVPCVVTRSTKLKPKLELPLPCITSEYADWFIEYAQEVDLTPEDLEIVLWG